MKTTLACLFIALSAFTCDPTTSSDVTPTDNLYKRWKSVEMSPNGKDWQDITTPEVVEFRSNGAVSYENRDHLCCSPTVVDRKNDVLKVVKTGDSDPFCAAVNCIGVSQLRIVSLNPSELVLDYQNGTNFSYSIRFEAVK